MRDLKGNPAASAAVCEPVWRPDALVGRAAARARPVAPSGDEFGPNRIV
ncbi:hypothetical protein [Burkholderia pyrrocinia]|nr:hypothetical protein [Burkholderia pyrrocinia]